MSWSGKSPLAVLIPSVNATKRSIIGREQAKCNMPFS